MLETARLVLKTHRPENFAKLHAWQNDPLLLHFNADSIVYQTEEQTQRALERWMDTSRQDIQHLAIYLKETGQFIGFAQIAFIDREHHRCKLAITIGDKAHWGQGYGTEAMRRIVDYCFTDLGMNRIGAEIYAFNERSIRAFERIGFRREGVIRENVLKERYFDEYQYGLLRREWEEGRGGEPS